MVFETIKNVIAEKMDIDAAIIQLESTLESLQIDSLDMVEISMDIEDALNVSLDDLEDAKTVKDVVDFVQSKQA